MNKKMKILLSAFVLLASAGALQAAGEAGLPDGNNSVSVTGSVNLSTGTSGLTETRRMRTTNQGYQLVYSNSVGRSSWTNVASDTRVFPMDGVDTSTLSANRNVFEVCTSSEPCFLRGFIVGDSMPGTATPLRLRVWDSRGSTDTAVVNPIFDQTNISSGSVQNFDQWVSTGITVMQSGTGKVLWRWDPTKRQNGR